MPTNVKLETGLKRGWLYCHECHMINRAHGQTALAHCARCSAQLHERVPNCLAKTWAFCLTAALLFLPANIYPVMTVVYLGAGQPDTIMSGVIHLLHAGMIPIALLVFIASIAVPLMKLVGLVILLLTVQLRWRLSASQCTVMYRYIEFIGRWSMLDLFMISILVTLVDLGEIATITAGNGATAFAGVVVCTMLAARSFDPRLLWDLPHGGNN
jgi:paraquat-inducible protein A